MDHSKELHEVEARLAAALHLLHLYGAADISRHSLVAAQNGKRAFSISEVKQLMGLGRTTIYKAIKERRLAIVKEGSRTLILECEVSRWLGSLGGKSGAEVGSEVVSRSFSDNKPL